MKDVFKNHKTKVEKKVKGGTAVVRAPAGASSSNVNTAIGQKSFFGRPVLTGKLLFEIERKEEINAEARRKADAKGKKNALPFYQPARSELWRELDEEEQAKFNEEAAEKQNDPAINQEAFAASIYADMNAFVRSQAFGGRFTMSLFFSWRAEKDDALVLGR